MEDIVVGSNLALAQRIATEHPGAPGNISYTGLIPYSAYFLRIFNFANFANLEPFAKLFQ